MSGITSVTLSTPGREPVTLTPEQFDRAADFVAGGGLRRVAEGPIGDWAVRDPADRALVTGGDPDEAYPLPAGIAFVDPLTAGLHDFIPAPDVEAVARALIDDRPNLAHLRERRISYLWRQKGGATGGKATLGQCQRAAGLVRHFGRVHFVIWLAWDHCELARLTRWQMEALIYHELLHAGVERGKAVVEPHDFEGFNELLHAGVERGKAVVEPHDFEGFNAELARYGSWQADLQRLVRTAHQLPLPGEEGRQGALWEFDDDGEGEGDGEGADA